MRVLTWIFGMGFFCQVTMVTGMSAFAWLRFTLLAVLIFWSAPGQAEEVLQRLSALRLLQLQSKLWNADEKHLLTLAGSLEEHYTTNGALASGGTSDWYHAIFASVTSSHSIAESWRVAAGADAGGFRYFKNPDLGTSYLDVWGSVTRDLRIGEAGASCYLTFTQEWNQLKNYSMSGSSTEVLAGFNAEWEFLPGQTVSMNPVVSATPGSRPMSAGYLSGGVMLTYDREIRHGLELSAFYNGYFTSYFSGQNDFTQYVGLSLTWSPCKEVTLSATASQTWNSSTDPDSRYSALDVGGMLGLQWRL